jgi:C4-dicarboxylate transporter DctM subunit
MNQIQFCIMMITALGVGFITPPLGLNLFVVSGITGESILKIAYRAIPFVFFMLIVTLMIAYIPASPRHFCQTFTDRTRASMTREYLKKAP